MWLSWLASWLHRGGAVARPSVRPRLEALEDRCVPTISHAFLGNGEVATLIAFDNGVLAQVTPQSVNVLATNVEGVHAYRDAQGQLGMDVVFRDGTAIQRDSSGLHLLGTNVKEASTTVAADGSFLTLINQENGDLFALTGKGMTMLGTNFDGACTYLDAAGSFGLLLNPKTSNDSTLLVQHDSTLPLRVLGPGFKEAEDNYGPNSQFLLDLTTDEGKTYEVSPTSIQYLGDQF